MAWSTPATATTGQIVTAAFWNQEVRDNISFILPDEDTADSWLPSLTATSANPAASGAGRQYQIGALMHVWQTWTVTGGDGGAGFWYVTLPVASVGLSVSASEGAGTAVGSWSFRDNSTPSSANGAVLLRAADEVWFNVGPGHLTHAYPFLITTGDVFTFHAVYPVA
jgi:hypothetical protein